MTEIGGGYGDEGGSHSDAYGGGEWVDPYPMPDSHSSAEILPIYPEDFEPVALGAGADPAEEVKHTDSHPVLEIIAAEWLGYDDDFSQEFPPNPTLEDFAVRAIEILDSVPHNIHDGEIKAKIAIAIAKTLQSRWLSRVANESTGELPIIQPRGQTLTAAIGASAVPKPGTAIDTTGSMPVIHGELQEGEAERLAAMHEAYENDPLTAPMPPDLPRMSVSRPQERLPRRTVLTLEDYDRVLARPPQPDAESASPTTPPPAPGIAPQPIVIELPDITPEQPAEAAQPGETVGLETHPPTEAPQLPAETAQDKTPAAAQTLAPTAPAEQEQPAEVSFRQQLEVIEKRLLTAVDDGAPEENIRYLTAQRDFLRSQLPETGKAQAEQTTDHDVDRILKALRRL